eukprot:COSAG04_NODE_529_length_13029_cov_3.203248_7_plen_98_part_00
MSVAAKAWQDQARLRLAKISKLLDEESQVGAEAASLTDAHNDLTERLVNADKLVKDIERCDKLIKAADISQPSTANLQLRQVPPPAPPADIPNVQAC